ncbi:MAG: DUF2892 domain-containing protein [Pseudomonadota bacterium]
MRLPAANSAESPTEAGKPRRNRLHGVRTSHVRRKSRAFWLFILLTRCFCVDEAFVECTDGQASAVAARDGGQGMRVFIKPKENQIMSNMNVKDRLVRIAIAAGLIYWALTPTGPTLAAGYTGLFMLATAAIGWCPFYMSFGFKTKKQ